MQKWFSSESVDEIPVKKAEQLVIEEFKEICKSKMEIFQKEIEKTQLIIEYDFCKIGQKYVVLALQSIYNIKMKEIIYSLKILKEENQIEFKKVYFTFLLDNKIKNGYSITIMNDILKIEQNIIDYSKNLEDLINRIKNFILI